MKTVGRRGADGESKRGGGRGLVFGEREMSTCVELDQGSL